jgi:Protein of unknown function (DUF938)
LPFSPAAERNKAPILAALQRLLPPAASVLEIASGTGQHAQHFASACPGWVWQPTDAADDGAQRLDVLQATWPLDRAPFSAVYCANMLHIAPWPTCRALMAGAARHLVAGGALMLYGPFRVDGVATAPSNEAFDADLRARDPHWGLRSLSAVEREALAVGLSLQQVLALPANNLLLVFGVR